MYKIPYENLVCFNYSRKYVHLQVFFKQLTHARGSRLFIVISCSKQNNLYYALSLYLSSWKNDINNLKYTYAAILEVNNGFLVTFSDY